MDKELLIRKIEENENAADFYGLKVQIVKYLDGELIEKVSKINPRKIQKFYSYKKDILDYLKKNQKLAVYPAKVKKKNKKGDK